jgi:hypothetical protein
MKQSIKHCYEFSEMKIFIRLRYRDTEDTELDGKTILENLQILPPQELQYSIHTAAKCHSPPLAMVKTCYYKHFTFQVTKSQDLSSRKQKSDSGTYFPFSSKF